jgi:hypothetical protein
LSYSKRGGFNADDTRFETSLLNVCKILGSYIYFTTVAILKIRFFLKDYNKTTM